MTRPRWHRVHAAHYFAYVDGVRVDLRKARHGWRYTLNDRGAQQRQQPPIESLTIVKIAALRDLVAQR